MSQTVVLEENVATESLILKFNDSSLNENPVVDSKSPNPVNNDDTGSKPDSENKPIPDPVVIPGVDSQTQAAVNAFIQKHASADEEARKEAVNELKSFLEGQEIEALLVLVQVAKDIDAELFNQVCTRIADMIKDKKVEEIREIFNITNDFTPEEEAAVRAENAWAFED